MDDVVAVAAFCFGRNIGINMSIGLDWLSHPNTILLLMNADALSHCGYRVPFACVIMDTNTNMKTQRWKLPEFRKRFMKQCLEGVVNQSDEPSTSGLVRQLERFELKLNGAADNEAEYCHWLSKKTKELFSQPPMNAESKPCLSNSNASGEVFPAQETGKSANTDWKEQVYQEIQKMNSAYFSKVYVSYLEMNKALQQLASFPQGSNTNLLEKLIKKMKQTECVLALFKLKKCQITTDTKKILDEAEKFVESNFSPKNVSSHHQGPSHSGISPLKIIETKPSQQAWETQNYYIRKDVSGENKPCLKEKQVKIMETKPSTQVLGTQNFHIWKDVSQQTKPQQAKIIETKSSAQVLGAQNFYIWKDVSQQTKPQQEKIIETNPPTQVLGTQNFQIWKDVSQQIKPQQEKIIETKTSTQVLGTQNSQQAKIIETNPLPQPLGTQNSCIWKDVSHQNKPCLKEQQLKIVEAKPSTQQLGPQNSSILNLVSQQNKPCLKEQQVEKQYRNFPQHVDQVSNMKGPDNAVQKQAQGSEKASEALRVSVNSLETSASPLTENCNKLKEFSDKSTLNFDEPSDEVKRILKVLAVISPEALSASVNEMRDAVYLNDVMATSEFLDEPREMVQQQNQPDLIAQTGKSEAFSQAGRKRSRSHSFNQLSDAEEPDWTSVAYKKKKPRILENSSLLEELKEINHRLVDSVIVVGENVSFLKAPGVAAEDSEGLVIEFLFNAVSFNMNVESHTFADKKSIIKPLRLFVPTNYPTSLPVIVDKELSEVSTECQKDLSTIAKSKLIRFLRCLDRTWSLEDIAMSWERCARETVLECAKTFGGETFSSIYGEWENYQTEVMS
ncbi:Mediator of RNA polymerase II transcription subunit 15a [Vigna angularis]|uniref:Mediator of RNA polymerase II transcription subunit 15a n=2 Tax=Phaseolus angularis TaxID=3914 RepID=A0A8T0KEQ3_PHAAN|nr:Mediator of RNA polymerase II transcription subunit 15a [Vigna angularis]